MEWGRLLRLPCANPAYLTAICHDLSRPVIAADIIGVSSHKLLSG